MNASNKLCHELVGEYTNFTKSKLKKFVGYKLVEKKNLNYYSIVTGLFRYRVKSVSENSYHILYERDSEYFTYHLVNRVAIFRTEEDAVKTLIKYKELNDRPSNLVILELTIIGDIEEASFKNSCHESKVVIGNIIDRVKEIRAY